MNETYRVFVENILPAQTKYFSIDTPVDFWTVIAQGGIKISPATNTVSPQSLSLPIGGRATLPVRTKLLSVLNTSSSTNEITVIAHSKGLDIQTENNVVTVANFPAVQIVADTSFPSVNLIPISGYAPFLINSVINQNYDQTKAVAALYTDTVYTVPANFILCLTASDMLVAAGTATGLSLFVTGGGNLVFNFQATPALGIRSVLMNNIFVDAASLVRIVYTTTAVNTRIVANIGGYLIPKM